MSIRDRKDVAVDFVLLGFDKKTERRSIAYYLRPVEMSLINTLFDTRNDPHIYNSYPVDQKKISHLLKYITEAPDLTKYDFFLEREEAADSIPRNSGDMA
jgi:hypothetical protein